MEMQFAVLKLEVIRMLELISISKKYDEKSILDNVNISLNKGKVTFIVGASGAGKTTLLNIIGGLDKPTSGSVIFNGKDIGNDLSTYRAKNIGFVFQNFNLISGLTIVQNVEIATEISGILKNTDEIISEIESLGISDPHQKVETLSGGEKQRAALIRSICKDADILIADEPTGNLDSSNACLVLDMLQSIKTDKYIIIVSHDIEKARKYADRIITLSDGNISSDETLCNDSGLSLKESDEIITYKPHYEKASFFNTILTLGKNSVSLRKGKIFSIALVIAIAIASLATVINLNKSGNDISNNVNINYLENDLMNLYYGNMPNTRYMEHPFSKEDILSLKNDYDIKENVLIYLNESNDWIFSYGSKTANVCLKQININDFFKERVFSNDVEGGFISNKNEVIIADDVAGQLFEDNCIGKSIKLNDGKGNSTDFTIVGINHTKNPFDETYSFVSAESLKDFLSRMMKENIFQRQELMTYYTEIQSMTTGGLYGSMSPVEEKENLLYGKHPASDENVLISSGLLVNVLEYFNIEKNYSYEDITKGIILSEDVNSIFSKKLALNFNGLFDIYVSGVYLSDKIEMRFTNGLITKMQTVDPIGLDVYVTNPEQVSKMKADINEKFIFEVRTELETLKGNVSMQTRFFSIALVLLGIVLLCISCALLSSFSKIAVLERKNEVAIIKSLGANNRSVLLILLFDSAVITLLSCLLSIIIFAALKFTIPYILTDIKLFTSGFPVGLIILISVIFSLLIFAQTGLTLRKLVKQMPAELFAQ